MSQDNIVVELKDPVTLKDGTVYTELTLGKMKAKHFKHLPSKVFDADEEDTKNLTASESLEFALALIPLIASMANVPEEVIEELDINDLLEVVNQIVPFLAKTLDPNGGK